MSKLELVYFSWSTYLVKAEDGTSNGEGIYAHAVYNLELINNMSISNEIDSLMAADKMSEAAFTLTEIHQNFQVRT